MRDERLKVGEVAARTGLSVRTLHHYHQIGLLRPLERTASGHRLYGRTELSRLQQILSLRQLGFALSEIHATLDESGASLLETLRGHRAGLDDHIEGLNRLRERLRLLEERVLEDDVSLDTLLQTIQVTTMSEKYFTPEQLEQLAERRAEVGDEQIETVQNHWGDLAARVNQAIGEGLDPASEPVGALAREWRQLTRETIAGFTGGDEGLKGSVSQLWRSEPDMGSEWGMGPEVREYMGQAIAALDD